MVEPVIVRVPPSLKMPPPVKAELPLMVEPVIVRVPPKLRMPPPRLIGTFPLEMVIPEMETTGSVPSLVTVKMR